MKITYQSLGQITHFQMHEAFFINLDPAFMRFRRPPVESYFGEIKHIFFETFFIPEMSFSCYNERLHVTSKKIISDKIFFLIGHKNVSKVALNIPIFTLLTNTFEYCQKHVSTTQNFFLLVINKSMNKPETK